MSATRGHIKGDAYTRLKRCIGRMADNAHVMGREVGASRKELKQIAKVVSHLERAYTAASAIANFIPKSDWKLEREGAAR